MVVLVFPVVTKWVFRSHVTHYVMQHRLHVIFHHQMPHH
jgi:hypothetical protein